MNDARVSFRPATAAAGAQGGRERKLPRRDWTLLPMLGLLTICVMAVSTESIAGRMFSVGLGSRPPCIELPDYSKGARVAPNTVCWGKLPESQITEYRFNSCGDRMDMDCGPKPPGVYRIVLTGTSTVLGRYVQREDTLAALLPAELSRLAGRKVEVYNKGMMWGFLNSVSLRADEVLTAKPDMVLWVLMPHDFETPAFVSNEAIWHQSAALPETAGKPGSLARIWYRIKVAYSSDSIQDVARYRFRRTQASTLLQHYLYESQSRYVNSFLMGGEYADFLRIQQSVDWQGKLRQFDSDMSNCAAQTSTVGVPLVVVLVPDRAQAAMISMGEWPVGYDPYKLDNELRSIVTSHGGTYIDILPGFRSIPNPEQYYYPVDGHPNANGHRIISGLLATALTGGAVPTLQVAAQPQAAQERER